MNHSRKLTPDTRQDTMRRQGGRRREGNEGEKEKEDLPFGLFKETQLPLRKSFKSLDL